jgi:hypothetical protein
VAQWLRRQGWPDYVLTSAVQEKRLQKYGSAVEHYHVVVFGTDYIDAASVRAVWGLGSTKHRRATSALHALRYINYLGHNGGRLSWSYNVIHRLPAGARPHSNCFRYVPRQAGFPGGIINFGWGHLRRIANHNTGESLVFVPSQGRIMPEQSTADHRLLWTCWRMTIDWAEKRAAQASAIIENNAFIERLRAAVLPSAAAVPFVSRGG